MGKRLSTRTGQALLTSGTALVLVLTGYGTTPSATAEPPTHRVTAADMTAWQRHVTVDDVFLADTNGTAAGLENELVHHCADFTGKLAKSLHHTPDPPYHGKEWRGIADDTADLFHHDLCHVIADIKHGKAAATLQREKADFQRKAADLDKRVAHWVNSVNHRFPSLHWDTGSLDGENT